MTNSLYSGAELLGRFSFTDKMSQKKKRFNSYAYEKDAISEDMTIGQDNAHWVRQKQGEQQRHMLTAKLLM